MKVLIRDNAHGATDTLEFLMMVAKEHNLDIVPIVATSKVEALERLDNNDADVLIVNVDLEDGVKLAWEAMNENTIPVIATGVRFTPFVSVVESALLRFIQKSALYSDKFRMAILDFCLPERVWFAA